MNELDSKKILQAFPNYYYIIDPVTFKILDSNDGSVNKGESFCYKQIYGLEEPCDNLNTNIKCTCKQVLKIKEKVEIVQKVNSKKGFFAYKVVANPILDEHKNIVQIIIQYIDITKEIQLENKLEEQNQELLAQNEEYLSINEELKEKNEEYAVLNEELIESNEYIAKAKTEIEGLKEFYENINEAVQDGIWVTDKNDVIFYTNPAMEKIAGISRMEIINKNVLNDFPKETVQEISKYFNQAKNELRPVWYEVAVKTPSEKSTYQNGWLIPLIKNGEYNGMICTVRDVSDRVNVKNILKKSEEKFRLLFENMHEAFALHEIITNENGKPVDYKFIDVNPEFEKQTGLKREDLINKTILEVLPNTEKYWIENYGKVAITGVPLEFENYAKELQKYYKVVAYSPKQNYFATIFEDITERKKLEQTLRDSEAKYRSLVEGMQEFVFLIDREYKILSLNQSAKNVLGGKQEYEGKSIEEVFPKHIYENYKYGLMQVFNTGKAIDSDTTMEINGKKLYIYASLSPLKNEKGETIAVVGLSRDITKRKLAEFALKESETRYKRAQEIGNVGNWEYNIQTSHFWGSDQAKRIYGFDIEKDEFSTDEVENCIPERKKVHQALVELIEKEKEYNLEFEIQPKDGTENKILRSIAELERDEKGNALKVIGTVIDITKQKKIENDLRESEEKYKLLVTNQTDLIVKVNAEGKFLFVSPSYCKVFGKSEHELLNNEFMPLVHPDDIEHTKNIMKGLHKKPYSCYVEQRAMTKDGWRWFGWTDTAVLDENKNVIEIIGLGRDITDQKNIEFTLRDKEQKLRNIAENSTNLFYQHTADHVLVYVSPQVKDILGYTVDEALVKWIEFATDNPINERGFKLTEKAIKTGEIQPTYELELRHKSGRKVWVEVREAPLIEKGKVTGIVGALTDISERKIAEDALKESEKRFRTYIESSPMAIFIINEKSQFEYANKAFSNLLSYSYEEILTMSIPDVKVASNQKDVLKDFIELKQKGKVSGKEVKYKTKKGQTIEIIIDAVKISDNQYIAFCTDITQIKDYERTLKEKNEEYYALNEELEENIERIQKINNELKIAKDKAEESDRLKSAFLANMSHELRTPLNGILGFSALIRKANLPKEILNRYSEIIESSGHRLLNVVNDLFDISLIHSDQMKIDKSNFEINDLLNEIYTFYRTVKKQRLSTIKFSLVKDSNDKIYINNDKYRVHQIFKNLIDNAFKFTSDGEIEFGYLPIKNNQITFYCKDSGIGVPKELQEIIFSSFRQVDDSNTRDYEGAGLGLSICSGLLERMGGNIWVESEKGMGATFYFNLPLDDKHKNKFNPENKEHERKHILKDKMILIVEDDLVSYEFLKIYLENIGSGGIIQTANGKDAVKILEKNQIDLVFMDIRLPDIDGYETTRRIREIDKKVIIIAQTAYALENDREKSIIAGCNDYITKPINEDKLFRLIKKYFH